MPSHLLKGENFKALKIKQEKKNFKNTFKELEIKNVQIWER